MTTREASKTAKEFILTKEKNNINARNVRFFQSPNSCSTDNTAKTLCCLQHGGGGDDRLTTNSRGKRKWTAGGCENELEQLVAQEQEAEKSFQTSGNKHLFKYINIYNIVFQRYTGPEKEKKGKLKWNTDEEN